LGRLVAIGYDGDTWGEALTNCQTSGYISQTSEVYAYAKAGPDTGQGDGEWHNYLIALVAFDPTSMWDYDFVGYAEVLSGTAQWYDPRKPILFWLVQLRIHINNVSQYNYSRKKRCYG
jgi:hypothetical protein